MKRFLFYSLIALIFCAVPAMAAQEAAVLESHGWTKQDMGLPGDSRLNPKVVTQPGIVFTSGYERPGTELPYVLERPKPIRYPRRAARAGWEGRVVLALEILQTGQVGRYQIMNSSGYRTLDDAAVQAVKQWKFQPARYDGKDFVTCIQMPVDFVLETAAN